MLVIVAPICASGMHISYEVVNKMLQPVNLQRVRHKSARSIRSSCHARACVRDEVERIYSTGQFVSYVSARIFEADSRNKVKAETSEVTIERE